MHKIDSFSKYNTGVLWVCVEWEIINSISTLPALFYIFSRVVEVTMF